MRLFSKVKPGTAFAAEAQNSGHQIPKPAALNTDTQDNALEDQVLERAAWVAVEADVILNQAAKMRQASQRHIAALWTDGSLGDIDGLPDRKTRIYISDSIVCKSSQVVTPYQQSPAVIDGQHPPGEQPAKKKRKGKAERNRLKQEAAQKATIPDAP
ncbi:TPA: hypothetical protein ACH3X2_009853 [Trebouxia sp. C0005]